MEEPLGHGVAFRTMRTAGNPAAKIERWLRVLLFCRMRGARAAVTAARGSAELPGDPDGYWFSSRCPLIQAVVLMLERMPDPHE